MSSHQPAWVKYQTLSTVLQRSQDDEELINFKIKRDKSAIVTRIRVKQNKDGSFPCLPWMHIHKYYFHQMLEMGYDLDDPAVKKGANNLLNYQLPDGGYMHPCGRYVNEPDPKVGWAACITGYVTHALITLGFKSDPRVKSAIKIMYTNQRDNGGWICITSGKYSPYCILSGTPWVFLSLAKSGWIKFNDEATEKTLDIFKRHKEKIIRHGYQRDRYYRCDESLVLHALSSVGLPKEDRLMKYFIDSLLQKQSSSGFWYFKGKPSAWYTLEAINVLNNLGVLR